MKFTTENVLRVQQELIDEVAGTVWECETAEEKAEIAIWIDGLRTMTDAVIKAIEEIERVRFGVREETV